MIIGVASALLYLLIFTLPFPLPRLYATIPPVDYTKLTGYSPAGLLSYVFSISSLFGLYWAAVRLTIPDEGHPSAITAPFIFLGGLIFSLILIFSYPLTAIDLFIYAIRTRGWALYELPPLATPPEALPSADPWLGLAGEWVDAASPYGPAWEWLSLGAFYLSGGQFLGHLLLLKIIGVIAYLGCTGLVYQILRRLYPEWATAGTIAFAWNPLVLFESVQNAHNDILMIFFLLLAIWLFIHLPQAQGTPRYWLLMLLLALSLALSILVKFMTVIVAPFFLLVIAFHQPGWMRRLVVLAGLGLLLAGVVLAAMAPVWPGWGNWAVLKAGSGAGRSLLALMILGLRDTLGTNTAFDLSRNLILAVFGLIYLYNLWRIFKAGPQLSGWPIRDSFDLLVSATFSSLFWYVLLAAPVFHAWYLLWFLPLAALLAPQQRPLLAAVVFSITALLIIPYFETVRVWYDILLENHFLGHLIGVPLLLLPPAFMLLRPISPATNSEVSSPPRKG
jgi:hypothetical protein